MHQGDLVHRVWHIVTDFFQSLPTLPFLDYFSNLLAAGIRKVLVVVLRVSGSLDG